MRPFIRKLLEYVAGLLHRLSHAIWTSPEETRVAAWYAAQGETRLRLEYDLNRDSVVFDLGGYRGQWTSDIHAMYGCRIYVFEPVPEFAEAISRRFQLNPKIRVLNFGLADETGSGHISLGADASSSYRALGEGVQVRFVGISDFLRDEGICDIDLMKINIEGGEYDLLEYMLDAGLLKRVRDIQVQFHDFIPNAVPRMRAIQQRLEQTHEVTYQFPFVWENWRLRK